jgi:adenylate cyclase
MPNTPRPLQLSSLLLVVIAAALHFSGALNDLDHRLGDDLLAIDAQKRQAPDDIVLINIDQKSLEAMESEVGSWPWPRAVHGELIDNLERFKPNSITFDILFNEADKFRADSDAVLRDTARQHRNLFFPSLLLADGKPAPLARLPKSFNAQPGADALKEVGAPMLLPLILDPVNWQGGLINFEADDDGVGRHAKLHATVDDWRLPSLAASIAEFSGVTLPASERIRLRWYGKPPRAISFSDLYRDSSSKHPVIGPTLAGHLLIVGTTAPGLHDFRPTPLNALTPGAEVLTTTIANLRTNDWLRDLPSRWPLALALLTALGVAFGRRVNLVYCGLALMLVTALILLGDRMLLTLRWYAPVGAALTLGWLAYLLFGAEAFWRERKDRDATVRLFSRFLDPRVVQSLVKNGELSRGQKPESRDITVLFSDIRGFTTLSETRTPEAVVELLNQYFSQQVAMVFRHGGTLDKFIGDAVMAFWNAPADNPHHAVDAVAAALDMAQALDHFKQQLAAGDPSLGGFDIGIGVHTGAAVVGFLGSDDRLDYTAIGDTVNLSSRIEGCTKGVARVLVSKATADACQRDAPGKFSFISHGMFQVKGRDQGVELFEPGLPRGVV